eukprot:TRINITY_DN27450_c0_g1_i3.p1 TRINITY_DN27450_c0_g1~~TRINITY_DN27450_c0_g1_i3.p1  ORF type:complete len:980 (+),score=265.06 TRINITY_DN27450_c0_g1_i3:99-3038(+)
MIRRFIPAMCARSSLPLLLLWSHAGALRVGDDLANETTGLVEALKEQLLHEYSSERRALEESLLQLASGGRNATLLQTHAEEEEKYAPDGSGETPFEKRLAIRVNAWWRLHAKKFLLEWDRKKIVDFFEEEDMQEVADAMADEETKMDGIQLYTLMHEYNEAQAKTYKLHTKGDWTEAKVLLWNELASSEEHSAQALTPEAKDRCYFCQFYDTDYTFGMEFQLFPPVLPWPNPIHTFVCQQNTFGEKHEAELFDDNKEKGPMLKMLQGVLQTMYNVLKSLMKGFAKLFQAAFGCTFCAICYVFQKLKDGLGAIGEAFSQAGRLLTASASNQDKRTAMARLADMQHSLLQKSLGNHAGWEKVHHFANFSSLLEMSTEDAQAHLQQLEDRRQAALKLIERIYEATFSTAFDKTMQLVEDRRFTPEIEVGAFRGSLSSVGKKLVEESSLMEESSLEVSNPTDGETGVALPKAKGVKSGQSSAPVSKGAYNLVDSPKRYKAMKFEPASKLNMPEQCKEMLDGEGNLQLLRDAFSIAVNIEEPALGDAVTSILAGDIAGGIQSLIPNVLIAFNAVHPDYGECFDAPKKLKEAKAASCTDAHRGSCHLAMKYRLYKKMIEGRWPPLEGLSYRTRRDLHRALDKSVIDTCLGADFVFGRLRSSNKYTRKGVFSSALTEEQAEANQEYADCRIIKKLLDQMEGKEDRYSSRIWYAAVQSFFLQQDKHAGNGTLVDGDIGAGGLDQSKLEDMDKKAAAEAKEEGKEISLDILPSAGASDGQPNVDPYIYQFCEAFLDCDDVEETKTAVDEEMGWQAFLDSFGRKVKELPPGATPGEVEKAIRDRQTKAVKQRLDMSRVWEKQLLRKEGTYASDDDWAIDNLQEVYVDQMKELLRSTIDQGQDPFSMTMSAFTPQLLTMTGENIDAPYDMMFHPFEYGDSKRGKLNYLLNPFQTWKTYIGWLEPLKEQSCTTLNLVKVCSEDGDEVHRH